MSSSAAASLLLPLRAARSVGLPISRASVAPVIDQIIKSHRWDEALALFSEERELLSRNNDLCLALVSRVRAPNSQWRRSMDLLREAAGCMGRHFNAEFLLAVANVAAESEETHVATGSTKASSSSSLLYHICQQLAENAQHRELTIIRVAAEETAAEPKQQRFGSLTRTTARRFELDALLNAGRWITATNVLSDLLPLLKTERRPYDADLPPLLQTTRLLQELGRHSRWVEGCHIFVSCFNRLVAEQEQQQRHSEKELYRRADLLGTAICTAASGTTAGSAWWRPLRAFNLVQSKLTDLPMTPSLLEAQAIASAAEMIIGPSKSSSSGSSTWAGHSNYSSSSSSSSSASSVSAHELINSRRLSDSQVKAGERAVSLILDLVRNGKWIRALEALHALPTATRRFHAARAAGGIMVHMSQINNWEAAFRVYNSVAQARARITRTAEMEESDQRALLFVCSQQRRWVEAFRLLQIKTRAETEAVAFADPMRCDDDNSASSKNSSSDDSHRSSNKHHTTSLDDRTDRIGIAFYSRPPWHVALQLARKLWPQTAGREQTRAAMLSNVAASALEHASRHHLQNDDGNSAANNNDDGAEALKIGLNVVDRMIAQGMVPRGEVLMLLPQKRAIEVARSGVVPLVEMVLAIRNGNSIREHHDKWSSNNFKNIDSARSNIAINWRRSLLLAQAACEATEPSDVFRRNKYCKAATEVLFVNAPQQWQLALGILAETVKSLSVASKNSSNHDEAVVAVKDARATAAVILHMLCLYGPASAVKAHLDATEAINLPLLYFTRRHSPFSEGSLLRDQSNSDLAARVLKRLRASMTQDGAGEPWVATLRDAFYFCSEFSHCGNKAVIKEGLHFFALMQQSDDGLRSGDGKHVVKLCALLSSNSSNSDKNGSSNQHQQQKNAVLSGGWEGALSAFASFEKYGKLNEAAVDAFFNSFDSQWELASRLFSVRYRDSVFRALLASGRLEQ